MKKNVISYFFSLIFVLLGTFTATAQIVTPVKWKFTTTVVDNETVKLQLKATIDKGWHLYSQFVADGGPVPTSFKFNVPKGVTLKGAVKERSKPIKTFEEAFGIDVIFFEKEALFEQLVKVSSPEKLTITGELEYMVCDDSRCLPPELVEFSFEIPSRASNNSKEASTETTDKSSISETTVDTSIKKISSIATSTDSSVEKISSANDYPAVAESTTNKGLWAIFFAGMLGGFIALLTPCVFPMIPLTVSFFTKRSSNKASGISQALIYSASIVVIYVALGYLVTVVFGSDALNDMASNVYVNMLFFALLVIFGISFLGAFEISLPTSFVNKMDAKSDKGGLIGIFFMAFTLSLVSFSCTGPIIGTLLVEAAVNGNATGPLVGMAGFSFALALPFGLFALFPSWLNTLPKSGGWLNSVKVVLGFLELALALKFLSNADLAYHWGILDREVFLVLWIVIFAMIGFYLLGKLKFSHDSDLLYISTPRVLMAIISFAFSIYMIPGLWGAPLKAISAFAPPLGTQDFVMGAGAASEEKVTPGKKYSELFECPHGIDCYFDYNQALQVAKEQNKPLFVDFTGHSCVNCRKMEASVWSDPQVLNMLKEDYIVVSLYVDDKTELEPTEQYTSRFSGKKIKTIGNKWSDLQASKYGTNTQPYYILLDQNEQVLATPRGYDEDVEAYVNFLTEGIKNYK